MNETKEIPEVPLWGRIAGGFIAGFLATLIFHQFTLAILWALKVAPFAPFAMKPTSPFGIPAVLSLAFWGGVWGILYVFVHNWFPGGAAYWAAAFLFGAVFPTLVAMLVVLPLKGMPVGGGGRPSLLITALLINGAWGIGTGLSYRFIIHLYTASLKGNVISPK